jgi:rifampin ADP-ribosylating transferase
MAAEDAGHSDEARQLFLRAWHEATNDFERFLAAHFVARQQHDAGERLRWLETAVMHASRVDDDTIRSAYPSLYSNIAACHELLGDRARAAENRALAASFQGIPSDRGPFYHGTRADLSAGDLLTPGGSSNYKAGLTMNHIYFTALMDGAGLAAALASGNGGERVYVVEPTGAFEHDPNVTDKKFPGNPTRSYRSLAPLRIVGEATDWVRQTPDQIAEWRRRLGNSKGDIIN